MHFPITFAKNQGQYDSVSPIINCVGNGAIIAAGSITVAAITTFALKALGFSKVAVGLAAVFPIALSAFGVIAAVSGFALLTAFCIAAAKGISRS